MKGPVLASAVLLLLCVAAAARREDEGEKSATTSSTEVHMGSRGLSSVPLRHAVLANSQLVAGMKDAVADDSHDRNLLIFTRRTPSPPPPPAPKEPESPWRKAWNITKKVVKGAMGAFSFFSTIACMIPGLQAFCVTAVLG